MMLLLRLREFNPLMPYKFLGFVKPFFHAFNIFFEFCYLRGN